MKTINKGDIVKSLAGHDKENLFLVMAISEDLKYVFLSDGKTRTVEKPKRKKIMHCKKVSVRPLEEDISLFDNAKVRKVLKMFLNEEEENWQRTV